VRLDTLPLGFALGLREGVELHLLQLTFGISLWPPRLELPFLPEIPWSNGVVIPPDRKPHVIPRMMIVDRPGQTETESLFNIAPSGRVLVDLFETDAWVLVEYAPAPVDPPGFRVQVTRFENGSQVAASHDAALANGRARLFEGQLGSRHVVLEAVPAEGGTLEIHLESTASP
jgi:hypothetical protein